MNQTIDFPSSFPEEERLKIIKLLTEKDKQIQSLEDKCLDFEIKLGDFNGGLDWRGVEKLNQSHYETNYKNEALERELLKKHLKVVRYLVDDNNPSQDGVIRPIDYKLQKISLFERFLNQIKKLIPFELKRKELPPTNL